MCALEAGCLVPLRRCMAACALEPGCWCCRVLLRDVYGCRLGMSQDNSFYYYLGSLLAASMTSNLPRKYADDVCCQGCTEQTNVDTCLKLFCPFAKILEPGQL